MPSFTSSSNLLVQVLLAFSRARRQILLTVVLVLLMGEIYMRLPFIPQRLEYEPDIELGVKLGANQVGYLWMADMSMPSPCMTLNNEGHRGEETDWSKPVILAVGDSEWMGMGVEDQEVWTQVLQMGLRRETGNQRIQVVNASQPGHGPYHQLVMSRRVLSAHQVDAILVRVFAGEGLKPIPLEERAQQFNAARTRYKIKQVTKFIPFLFNKIQAQLPSIEKASVPTFFTRGNMGMTEVSASAGRAVAVENRLWWEQMVSLAEHNDVPIVFVIHDIRAEPGSLELEVGLKGLAEHHPYVYVVRQGPEKFGLDSRDKESLRKAVHETLTLRRDPHANAIQHRLIAQGILTYLKEIGLIPQILEKNSRQVTGGREDVL